MRVEIDPSVFAREEATIGLILIASACRTPRGAPVHRLVANVHQPQVAAWLAAQSEPVRNFWCEAAETGRAADATAPMEQTLNVHHAIDDWARLRLGVSSACRVLNRPLAIVCEDQVSDRQFIESIVPLAEQRWFDALIKDGLIRFEGTGGIGNFGRVANFTREERLRAFAIMDSDAIVAGAPSADSTTAVAHCQNAGIRYHRLAWRFAESYLSDEALSLWVEELPRGKRRVLRARVSALRGSELRPYFNMKGGDAADRKRTDPVAIRAQWDAQRATFNDYQRKHFERGFGGDVARAFTRECPPADGAAHELAQIFEALRGCL